MESAVIPITQIDGYETRLFYYEAAEETVLGTVLILHGMTEHHERYNDFIQALTREGFDVYTYDHRGHGTDKKLSELGFVAPKKGASLLIEDALSVFRYIAENKRSEKLAVFGHSMGSLILRCMMQRSDVMDCAIVSSTTRPPAAVSFAGTFLAGLLCLMKGARKQSPFLQNAMFGGKAYTALCTRTTYDWLTRNNTVIGKYIDDPYCGFLCTTSFYRDLARLASIAARKRGIARTRRDLPVLFLAGDKDPVSGYATQVVKLHHLYTTLNFTNAKIKVYPEARHELLNELNYTEVYQDIISYLHSHLA